MYIGSFLKLVVRKMAVAHTLTVHKMAAVHSSGKTKSHLLKK